MYTVFLVVHVICCIMLVAVVLLQVGRGRGMLGFLGSGTVETMFGSRAGDILTKSTTAVAVLFMVTSLSLAYISVKRGGSVMKGSVRRSNVVPKTASTSEQQSAIVRKGANMIQKAKDNLLDKIPNITGQETSKKGLTPSSTTKSKVNYDDNGNKVVDELKYDSQGQLIDHTQVTYDKLDREIDRVELPLGETVHEK